MLACQVVEMFLFMGTRLSGRGISAGLAQRLTCSSHKEDPEHDLGFAQRVCIAPTNKPVTAWKKWCRIDFFTGMQVRGRMTRQQTGRN